MIINHEGGDTRMVSKSGVGEGGGTGGNSSHHLSRAREGEKPKSTKPIPAFSRCLFRVQTSTRYRINHDTILSIFVTLTYIHIYIYMLTYLSRRQQLDHPFPPGRPPYPSLFRHPHTTHPYHPITSTTERMVHFNPPSLHHHLFRSRSPSLSPHYLSLI